MRIATIDPSAFTIPYDRHLCHALGTAGNDVILFTRAARQHDYFRSNCNPDGESDNRPFFTDELFCHRSLRSKPESKIRQFRFVAKAVEHFQDMRSLHARLCEFQPTAIHFQWLVLPIIDAYFVKKLRRLAPVFLTVHDAEALHSPTSKIQLFGWTHCLTLFDGLIAHTQHTRKSLELMGIPTSRIRHIPHGLLRHTECDSTKQSNTAITGDGVFRLLFFGSIKQYKGLDVLIRALSLLPPALRQRVRLRVAGNPNLPEREIRHLAAAYGVEQMIDWQLRFFCDEEIDGLFQESDVVVFPYRRIDASGALMAALPYRKAIIASQVGQFSELLESGKSAILVRPEDPQELARAIEQYALDPKLRIELAAGANEVVRSIPLWSDIAKSTIEFYRQYTDVTPNS